MTARTTMDVFDRRAVSDAIGFVLIFSLIVTTIGLVYVAGYDSITTAQTGEQLQNAERTFETIERNFDDIERRQAPARAAEINLNGGTVSVESGASIRVNVTGAKFDEEINTSRLAYEKGGRRLDYENGAVVRTSEGHSVVLTDAKLECREDVAIVSVVKILPTDRTVSGTNVVTIYNRRVNATLLYPTNRSGFQPDGVNVTVSSANADGWNRYLEERDGWSDSDGDGSYHCTGPDEVFVRVTVFDLRLDT
jgi:hypothetical protein